MKVDYIRNEDVLLIEFNEEIDHCKTEELRNKIDYEIEKYSPKKVIFDFQKVNFMDSAGIGFLLRKI